MPYFTAGLIFAPRALAWRCQIQSLEILEPLTRLGCLQADTGGQNSDSAEEVAWVPERHAHPCHLPPSPMAKAVGQECAAAVNLLSMSVHENNLKQAARVQRSPGNAHKEALQVDSLSCSLFSRDSSLNFMSFKRKQTGVAWDLEGA